MKIYRICAIIISLIIGIFVCVFEFSSENAQIAIKDPLTEDHIDFLKKKALEIAKTMDKDIAQKNDLNSDFYYSEDQLFVVVESNKTKITAKVPIFNQEIKLENGTVFIKGITELDKIQFEQENKIKTKYKCIFSILGMGIFVGILVFLILQSIEEKIFYKTSDQSHQEI